MLFLQKYIKYLKVRDVVFIIQKRDDYLTLPTTYGERFIFGREK